MHMTVYIILLIIGLLASLLLLRSILLGRKSRTWPSTGGTILQSAIDTVQSVDDDGTSSTSYGLRLQYEFSVGGQAYQGNRRTFAEMRTSSYRSMQKLLERFPQGGSVTVFYDPDDPSSCVLEPGVGNYLYIVLVFTGIMMLAGLAGLLGLFG
jgi:hypothetical protein